MRAPSDRARTAGLEIAPKLMPEMLNGLSKNPCGPPSFAGSLNAGTRFCQARPGLERVKGIEPSS